MLSKSTLLKRVAVVVSKSENPLLNAGPRPNLNLNWRINNSIRSELLIQMSHWPQQKYSIASKIVFSNLPHPYLYWNMSPYAQRCTLFVTRANSNVNWLRTFRQFRSTGSLANFTNIVKHKRPPDLLMGKHLTNQRLGFCNTFLWNHQSKESCTFKSKE